LIHGTRRGWWSRVHSEEHRPFKATVGGTILGRCHLPWYDEIAGLLNDTAIP